jgi:hypothetical protein
MRPAIQVTRLEPPVEMEAKLVSFVLRFVGEESSGEPENRATAWYSVIRHVQSDTERRLTRWEDIVAFINQYVDLGQEPPHD